MSRIRPVSQAARLILAVILLAFGLGAAGTTAAAGAAPSGVHLPRDEAPHQQPTEWWYFSGHLSGRDPAGHIHRYGFEYVTFQFLGLAPAPVYYGNLAVTDLTRHTFEYAALPDSYPVPVQRNRFAVHTGPWRMSGRNGHDTLTGALTDYGLALHTRTTERAAIHGDHGTIPYGPFGTSQYYSWTSLRTTGVVLDHGVPVTVHGQSWMDHQWGPIDFSTGGGWDWFSVQLTNGQQYMLYFIRDAAGRVVATVGSRVDRRGTVHLDPATFSERATGTWHSPSTGLTYTSGWCVTVPGGHLLVTPTMRDQELDLRTSQGVVYWEGDVSVRGRVHGKSVSGQGYTEINPPASAFAS